ncbi:hypothetical protein KI387_023539 [Taxus chinensis]|uniref:RING-type E3 ubiquitin transferase n=1 Tax=Taxus chinensis TaxID=29808 RepID=A0AA38G1U3_TAXCH|nr:hypothetical protein KI387_023539 [Taxus chinensis]
MSRWWCHRCSRRIRWLRSRQDDQPVCPYCHGGFVEQISSNNDDSDFEEDEDESMSQMMQSLTRFLHHSSASSASSSSTPFFTDPFFFPQGPMEDHPDGYLFPFFNNNGGLRRRRALHGNLGDLFLGPALEQLVNELALSDRRGGGGAPPASKTSVDALETVMNIGGDGGRALCCAVCKEDFGGGGGGAEVKKMPCQHMYHSECILPWLARHNSCPVCRYEMPTDDPEYDRMRSRGPSAGSSSGRRFRVPHFWPFRASNRTSVQVQAETSSSQSNDIRGNSPRTPQRDDDDVIGEGATLG